MLPKISAFVFVLGIIFCINSCTSKSALPIAQITPSIASKAAVSDKRDSLAEAFKQLRPTSGDAGLLLAFDTDAGDDAHGYAQFYDEFTKVDEKPPTNRTYYLVRTGDSVKLAAKLDYVASPQKTGFLYLGQARYFEPKPRDKNEDLDHLESKGGLKNFAYDYSRVWRTTKKSEIPSSKRAIIAATKREIDAEYRKLQGEEREYHRNITDNEKIGFISNGYYVVDGFWSQVTGGAAWFQAYTKSEVVSLPGYKIAGTLHHWFPKRQIIQKFEEEFNATRRNSEDAKYNNMNAFWQMWLERLSETGTESVPTFTLERRQGRTHMVGLVLIDGNRHRSFHADADFGAAPKSLIAYDNPIIDFAKLKEVYPTLIDVYVSPNQNTVFLLTDKEIVGIDVKTRDELYRDNHDVVFNKVVMVEWATNDHVSRWWNELSR